MAVINYNFWKGRRVLVTGHTGFKGSWLTLFLNVLEADITGYSLDSSTSFFPQLQTPLSSTLFSSVIGDITDKKALSACVSDFQPEVIFHLAAQPLVSVGYSQPFHTWHTNLTGTLNLLDSLVNLNSTCSVVIVTTDKVYKNFENVNGYSENDQLGGFDPYSASKAAIELLVESWRNSNCLLMNPYCLTKLPLSDRVTLLVVATGLLIVLFLTLYIVFLQIHR